MSQTSTSSNCPICGAPLDPDDVGKGCPRCLMLAAMEETKHPGSALRQPPPSIEAVQGAFPQLTILELIGEGGMGCVFKARQPKLNRFVALKLLPAALAESDPAFAGRFEREGQLLARLHHPNIVAVHDSGTAGDYFYLIMEFVDGVNLRQTMRSQRFTAAQALAIVPRICDALQYAHDEGVLHRDIKPENILLDSKGRVKLADFGIAKLLVETEQQPGAKAALEGTGLTHAGASLGTPNYMAPEQRESPGDVDHRADIYSLGVVIYELLTNELPSERFAPPSKRSDADPRLDAVVAQALERERERRQRNAAEVKTQVEGITGTSSGSSSNPQRSTYPGWSPMAWLALSFALAGVLTPPVCLAFGRLNEGGLVLSILLFLLAAGFGWVTRKERAGNTSAVLPVVLPLAAVAILAVVLFVSLVAIWKRASAQRQAQMATIVANEAAMAKKGQKIETWTYQTRHLDERRLNRLELAPPGNHIQFSRRIDGLVSLTGSRDEVRRAATLLRLMDQPVVKNVHEQPLLNMPPEYFTRFALLSFLLGKAGNALFTDELLETLKTEGVSWPQIAMALSDHVLEIENAAFNNTGTPFENIIHSPGASTTYEVSIPCADRDDASPNSTRKLTFTIERTTQQMGTQSKIASLPPWLISEAKEQQLAEIGTTR